MTRSELLRTLILEATMPADAAVIPDATNCSGCWASRRGWGTCRRAGAVAPPARRAATGRDAERGGRAGRTKGSEPMTATQGHRVRPPPVPDRELRVLTTWASAAALRRLAQAASSASAGNDDGGPRSSQVSVSTIRSRMRSSSSSRSGDGGRASSCRASSRSCISRSSRRKAIARRLTRRSPCTPPGGWKSTPLHQPDRRAAAPLIASVEC